MPPEPLQEALETAPSGTLITVATAAGDDAIVPLATYVDTGGRYCREFQTTRTSAARADAAFGMACRSPAGDWQLRAVVPVPPAGDTGGRFVTASGGEDAFQAVLDALTAGGPISLDDEAALLDGGWR